MTGLRGLRTGLIALIFVCLPLSFAGQKDKPATKTKPSSTEVHPSRNADASLYVGTETCKTCHEEEFKSYDSGPHWRTEKNTKQGVQWQGCEACHGHGKDHVEGGGDVTKILSFKKMSPEAASQQCLDCHETGEEHTNFARSEHLRNGVGCVSCHSVHKPKVEQTLLKVSQPTLCYSCHLETKPDFSKPFHHRVNEGLVKCSDCHNPHGGFLNKQLRSTAAQDQVCFGCHAEKAGPFVFEHAPVKTEGCVACHTPHGSSNPRLLKRANINLLCLECHTFTVDSVAPAIPSFHNQAAKYQACTMCHTQIHGSNMDDKFFK
ncbi:MAG: DmsE family decaheme c-type cytochrome [Acidobacteriota bacterium]|nr:DmsE family decaheme c-type cytochrome [Acidobacteriota bacterium]